MIKLDDSVQKLKVKCACTDSGGSGVFAGLHNELISIVHIIDGGSCHSHVTYAHNLNYCNPITK